MVDQVPPSFEPRAVSRKPSNAKRLAVLISVLAVVAGASQAILLAWISDDAYISFRYARHLVDGFGLVYNAGERVEGYTNFAWTLWCALGLRLGASAEAWANIGSILCYLATIAILAVRSPGVRSGVTVVPLAAMLMALHEDAATFATSGLETALFTFLAVAGYLALSEVESKEPEGPVSVRSAGIAGVLLALSALTRPDGVLFCALGLVYLGIVARKRPSAWTAFAVALVGIGAPYALWKLAYYGDLLPNTFYAKSAARAWYDQGWVYAQIYFSRYPVLLLGPVFTLGIIGSRFWRPASAAPGLDRPRSERLALLAAAFALTYTAYVIRVGGDFMFARLLIPATPFFALGLEQSLAMLAQRRAQPAGPRWQATALALIVIATVGVARAPLFEKPPVRGIVDERDFYDRGDRLNSRDKGQDLGVLTRGIPVRASIIGTQAIIAYYANVQTVIECSAGLTDAFIARQSLEQRGRVGHEKSAPLGYLIDQRRVHFHVGWSPALADTLRRYIPVLQMRYRTSKATVLTWDPAVMAELRRRGAWFEDDFENVLDEFIADLPNLPDSTVADMYERSRRFYFDGFPDPAREKPFLERLRRQAS